MEQAMKKIVVSKMDNYDIPPVVTEYKFRNDDTGFCLDDFYSECSIQAKYRAKITGSTQIAMMEGETVVKSVIIESK
jgi:hypothetical protein